MQDIWYETRVKGSFNPQGGLDQQVEKQCPGITCLCTLPTLKPSPDDCCWVWVGEGHLDAGDPNQGPSYRAASTGP